ncbi:ABC transporter substrate-binding protein [Vogesella sp. EB]|uniref:cobalamin-binding protein n=1 Tax=Vogesella sp. EB TaxID=1526735 RepID=UPI00064CDEAA|nr:cobalamin-binding protein [Vogesella sp. EB]KMJ52361.1 ABC transporter substrate-binding protein [Vogesella sp. EB]
MRRWPVLALLAGWALPAAAQLSVTDGLGQTVTLPAPARRIVVLVPHAVETLYTIGAAAQIVAVVEYSDHPPAARQLPRVGSYSGISLEAILRLRPELVVAWRDGSHPRELARLRALGIPLYISAPQNVADIAREMRALGRLSGQQRGAAQQAARFEQQFASLRQRYASARPVATFVQVGDTPLFSVSRLSFVDSLVRLCGGRNVFADAAVPAPQVSVEAVLARRPQLILAFEERQLAYWQRWPQLPAVALGNLSLLTEDSISRPGPRLADGARQLCRQIDAARQRLPAG